MHDFCDPQIKMFPPHEFPIHKHRWKGEEACILFLTQLYDGLFQGFSAPPNLARVPIRDADGTASSWTLSSATSTLPVRDHEEVLQRPVGVDQRSGNGATAARDEQQRGTTRDAPSDLFSQGARMERMSRTLGHPTHEGPRRRDGGRSQGAPRWNYSPESYFRGKGS